MKKLFTLLFALLSFMAYNQEYKKMLRHDATWDVRYWGKPDNPLSCRTQGYERLSLGRAVLINNKNYYEILTRGYSLQSSYPCTSDTYYHLDSVGYIYGYAREDTMTKRVYFYCSEMETEFLIYDFSLLVGDSISLPGYPFVCNSNSYSYSKVSAINKYLLNSNEEVYEYRIDLINILESIGSLSGPFHPYSFGEEGTELVCYKLNNFIKYGREIPNTIESFIFEVDFKIYPNPASNVLNITAEKLDSYEILDMTGKMVLSGTLIVGNNEINVNALQSAYYFVRMISKRGVTVGNFVKE